MTALWHHVNTSRHERSSRRIDENQKAINRLYINSSWAKRICFFYCVILSTWACTRPRSADGYQSRQVDVSHPERVAIVTGTIETPKKKKKKRKCPLMIHGLLVHLRLLSIIEPPPKATRFLCFRNWSHRRLFFPQSAHDSSSYTNQAITYIKTIVAAKRPAKKKKLLWAGISS